MLGSEVLAACLGFGTGVWESSQGEAATVLNLLVYCFRIYRKVEQCAIVTKPKPHRQWPH